MPRVFYISLHQIKLMPMVITSCLCCKSQNITQILTAKDFTVSQELYEIWQCNNCTLRFTRSIPDKNEIGKYYQSENYISHSDTNKGFVNSLYHTIRRRTLVSKKKLIEKFTEKLNGKILDVGAGTGAFLKTMQEAGWNITGLEPDETARLKAKELYNLQLQSSETLFKLAAESFDAITLWHVLEHVHELHEYVEQLKKLLKPNGCLFVAVPNYTCYDQKVYKEYWAAYDVPRHLYHFSPDAMINLLHQHGLQLHSILPMWYDSIYVSMLSEKYKTGKSNLMLACLNGFISNLNALFNNERCSSVIYVIKKSV